MNYATFIQPLLFEAGCPEGIELFPKTTSENGIGIGFRKDFHYGKVISRAIREIYRSEHGYKVLNTKWDSEYQPVCENKDKVVPRFGWEYFSGILVIVSVTTIAGCIMNIFEYIFVYFYRRRAFNINTPKELQQQQQQQHFNRKSAENMKNEKLVRANRALSAYLKDTIALESHKVILYQHEQFHDIETSAS